MEQKKFKTIAFSLLLVVAGFIGGFIASGNSSVRQPGQIFNISSGKPANADFSLFWDVWNKIDKQYVDQSKIDYRTMMYGAIDGMVKAVGDPYTSFFTPQENSKFQEDISGSFSGIGIEIAKKDEYITVVAPIKNTPADRAGLKSGDRIIQIDEQPTRDMAIEDAVALIRGKKGTKVTLTILPPGEETQTKQFEVTRDTIKVPTVEWEMIESGTKSLAHLRIYTFNQNVESQFEKAANEILNSKADGIILDVRGNPGGLLDSALNIAEWFLEKGNVITHEQFRDGTKETFAASRNGLLRNYRLVVLIDGGSASASEIIAGALADSRGATLVGVKTFGKGSVQQLDELRDGSGIKITIAKWLTPNGVSISEKGIEPSVKVEVPEQMIKESTFASGEKGKDPQLDYAIDFLSK